MNTKEIRIRTSDRGMFRHCRRQWNFVSDMRKGYKSLDYPSYFWLGTGVHFALEDFHGYGNYQTPSAAFRAYCEAWDKSLRYRKNKSNLNPNLEDAFTSDPEWIEAREVGLAMMEYYPQWLSTGRDPLKTLWEDDRPQCEVRFEIELPIKTEAYEKVYYVGTIDRVCIDEHDRIWLVDYKTAKQFQITHLDTDAQITAYMWAASKLYDKEVAGFVYQQHKKVIPKGPAILKNGHVSTNKQAVTTWRLYCDALVAKYGSVEAAPMANQECLNALSERENEHRDAYICRDIIERNKAQLAAEEQKILMEVGEMLSPELNIYPSPNRFCGYCGVHEACVALDDGSDWQGMLEQTMSTTTDPETENWRNYL